MHLQGGRADWLVEKAAELGAYSLRPLVSERVHAAGGGATLLYKGHLSFAFDSACLMGDASLGVHALRPLVSQSSQTWRRRLSLSGLHHLLGNLDRIVFCA